VVLLEHEDLGAQLTYGGDHARAEFRALAEWAEVELAMGAGASATDYHHLQDLVQDSLCGMGATYCTISNNEVKTHSVNNTPFPSWTPHW
jgi:hypothetical protein